MIKISLDPGYVFDILAIMSVKLSKGLCSIEEYDFTRSEVKAQIGDELFEEIIHSDEFGDLMTDNYFTFLAVDKAKNDEVKASRVHNLNARRYASKISLQKRFFPDIEVKERKN